MSSYLLAIDQGTTSSRCILFSPQGEVVYVSQKEFKQYYPVPGWVQHDPEEIWQTVQHTLRDCIEGSGVNPIHIKGIGITNQRETTVVWDRDTGKAVYPAIVWQSRQSEAICQEIEEQGYSEIIKSKTGLVIDPYFSATKISWILKNITGAREAAEAGKLAFGTIDTWLIWKLSEGKVHATDAGNAARTLLLNIHTGVWDTELLEIFNIPSSMLPGLRDSAGRFCETPEELTGIPIPVSAVAGDQQAALFGQGCIHEGMAKNTYGTGCFMLMNTGTRPVVARNGILSTVAWRLNGELHYALEGSVFVAGAAIQWLRDELRIISDSAQASELAESLSSNQGVYFVPAFVGLGAPHWDSNARGTIFGITRGTTRAHIVRAAVEAMAYQSRDVFSLMQSASGIPLKTIRVDGAAAKNNILMQFQADLLQVAVDRPLVTETTALGAALLAGLAEGVFPDVESCAAVRQTERIFKPQAERPAIEEQYNTWKKAVEAVRLFHSPSGHDF